MKGFLRRIFHMPELFYPPLLAVFPILFLYAHNSAEMSAANIVGPIAISSGFTVLLMAFMWLILRSASKAALAASIFVILFFSYGRAFEHLEQLNLSFIKHSLLLPGVILVWGYIVYFIKCLRIDLRSISKAMFFAAALLVTLNLLTIGISHARSTLAAPERTNIGNEIAGYSDAAVDERNLPDIYIIIFDELAHPDTMLRYYNYDSSAFIDFLRNRGFIIADNSVSRSPWSMETIASILNMKNYSGGFDWDSNIKKYRSAEDNEIVDFAEHRWKLWAKNLYDVIVDNFVTSFLKSKGYKYYYLGNWYEKDRWGKRLSAATDFYYNYDEHGGSGISAEFERVLYDTTMLRPFYVLSASRRHGTYDRRGLLNALSRLNDMPHDASTKIVIAHIMSPHPPIVFGPHGEFIPPKYAHNFKDKQYYLGQYRFIIDRIEQLVEVLQDSSRIPPVIVIMSDHGLRPIHEDIDVGEDDWRKIIYAIYLPGENKEIQGESLSPVDTFRIILNSYFGTTYKADINSDNLNIDISK